MTTRPDDTDHPTRFPFTLRRVAELPNDRSGIYRDVGGNDSVAGLIVRISKGGSKSYAFDRNFSRDGKRMPVRLVIGRAPDSVNDQGAISLQDARAISMQLNAEAQAGRDPRAVKAERARVDAEAREAEISERFRLSLTLREVWDEYLKERSPDWSERHFEDAVKVASPGGEPYKRGEGVTKPGPLASLMCEPLASIDQERITDWAKVEGPKRQTQARLARRHLFACLRWCMEEGPKEWRTLVQPDALRLTETARRRLGKAGAKEDRLERPHLQPFFEALAQHGVPVTRDYILTLLVTGARKNEITTLRWPNIDWRWKRMTLHNKDTTGGGADSKRVVPLTPYLESVLRRAQQRNDNLPKGKRSRWVFASNRKEGEPLKWANNALAEICEAAGIPRLSIHGLRRSFTTLTESADLPAGAVAQIQGHAPTATAEKHYRRRSIDELAAHAERWEKWLLDAAGIEFTPRVEGLSLVKG